MAFSQYSGQTVGRLMYFLYKYTFHSDSWTFDCVKQEAYEHKKLVAKWTWDEDGDSDYPTFEFFGGYEHCLLEQERRKQDLIDIQEKDNFLSEGREKWSKKEKNAELKADVLKRKIRFYKGMLDKDPDQEHIDVWKNEIQEEYGNERWW